MTLRTELEDHQVRGRPGRWTSRRFLPSRPDREAPGAGRWPPRARNRTGWAVQLGTAVTPRTYPLWWSTTTPSSWAAAIGEEGARVLVLADEPATTCYLPEHQAFVRWLGADSEVGLIAAVNAVLNDPTAQWETCGAWETDGSAVLMESVTDGAELEVEYTNGAGLPEPATVPIWLRH
ncbi:Imm21 family immunity protein [Streptomyces sp. NPDC055749]